MTNLLKRFVDWLLNRPADARSPQSLALMVQQIRAQMQRGITLKLNLTYPDQSRVLAELLTNYIFDFGNYGIDPATHRITRQTINGELAKICKYKLVTPQQLCMAVVHRAIQLREFEKFEKHMRDLWMLSLIPVGKFTPADTAFPTRAHQNLAHRLRSIEITPRQIEAYQKLWSDPQLKA